MTNSPLSLSGNLDDFAKIMQSMGKDVEKKLVFPLKRAAVKGRDIGRKHIGSALSFAAQNTRIWTQRGIVASRADKKTLSVQIYANNEVEKKGRGFLANQQNTATHSPKGKNFAVPTKNVPKGSSGRIRTRDKPTALIKKAERTGQRRGKWAYFTSKDNKKLFRRRTRAIGPGRSRAKRVGRAVQLVYSFTKRKKVEKKTRYFETILPRMHKILSEELNKEVRGTIEHQLAKKTAKMKKML